MKKAYYSISLMFLIAGANMQPSIVFADCPGWSMVPGSHCKSNYDCTVTSSLCNNQGTYKICPNDPDDVCEYDFSVASKKKKTGSKKKTPK